MPTPASRRVREPLHEQGLCNGYGRGEILLLRQEADMRGALTHCSSRRRRWRDAAAELRR